MEDKIYDIVTDLLSDDITKQECIDSLLNLLVVSSSYQFYIFEGNSIMVDRDVAEMQEDGWELAGEVATKFGNNGGMPRMIVPLKRKI